MFSMDHDPNNEQLTYFLAWIKWYYVNAYNKTPGPGQALVLAGEVGKGKTFFSKAVLGGLMGGFADASTHLVEGSQWTSSLAESPIMGIDDAIATANYQDNMKLTQRIKRYVANASINYNQKFGSQGEVPWLGRVVITCNLDMESQRIIPGMDLSTRDKIMLFRASALNVQYESWAEMAKILARELPNFARFLIEWEMPDECIADEARFGVKPYHDKQMFDQSIHQSADSVTTEVLVTFLHDFFETNPKAVAWSGPSIQLHSDMSLLYEGIMRNIKPRQLATCLGKLQKNGLPLETGKSRGLRTWTIPLAFLEEQEKE